MRELESTLQVGHLLRGQYTVIEVLGQGASGAVYLVKDERDSQKRFVLKEVRFAHRGEQNVFSFDAAALKRLYHPVLPDIYKIFSNDKIDRFYILMDYAEGSNLEEVRQLMPGKRFSLRTTLTLLSPIMDATGYLHRQQPHLVHGDIKPSNIIASLASSVTPTKLVDFGGADNSFRDTSAQQSSLNYRAPEQFGKRASRRTDVYGLGATIYTLLTGIVPVAAPDRLEHIAQGKPDPLLSVNKINPFVHPAVAEAIGCAMSLSRDDRYASVEQFHEVLWQLMHISITEPQTPDFSFIAAVKELAKPDMGPNSSMLESDSPALIAYALMQEEVTFAGVNSGPLRTPVTPKEENLSVEVASQERSGVIRRKKRRVPVSSGAHGTYKHRRRKSKKRAFFLIGLVLLILCVCGSGVAIAGSQIYNAKYQSKVAMAQVGIKHLETGVSLMQAWSKKPLDISSITHAQQEFAAASAVFTQLDTDLQAYARYGSLIPGLSTRLNAALHLVPIATEIAQAGVAGCDALNVIISRIHEPFGKGVTSTDLKKVGNDFHEVQAAITKAIAQVKSLQPGDVQFDARISRAVVSFHQYLPTVQTFLSEADQLLPVLPALLGINTPAYYLVELLDSTQLRPGGGFIKDYGFATFVGGQLNGASTSDTSLLDNHFNGSGQTIHYPPAYKWFDLASTANGWNLRDSNLDADFPTAAGYAEQNYNLEGGKATVQGVIAITTTLMQHALAITGPINLPELHETVSAQNLIDRLHYYQIGPGTHITSVLRPGVNATGSIYFTAVLAKDFLTRIHQFRSSDVPQLVQMLVSSMHTKDLQIYFNAAPAEGLLKLSNINATIQAPKSDSLFVVDANVAADTANQYITNTLNDQVTIDDSGNAVHHTVLHYAWLKNGPLFGSPLYSDYVRIYVPPGSSLQTQQGWHPGETSEYFNREVWAGSFTLSSGQTNTITLIWTEKGVAKQDKAGWHYQYLVQRQAGVNWTLNVQVRLPVCAMKTRTSGGLVSHNSQAATLNKALSEDTNLGIDYSC